MFNLTSYTPMHALIVAVILMAVGSFTTGLIAKAALVLAAVVVVFQAIRQLGA